MTIQTRRRATLLAASLLLAAAPFARAAEKDPAFVGPEPVAETGATTVATTQDAAAVAAGPRLDISGFAMLDMGYQSGQNHPDWFDVVRPTKLPAFENEFGEDGRFYAGVRQSRLERSRASRPPTSASSRPSSSSSSSAPAWTPGQTTFRLRHAWGELGQDRRRPDLEPVHGPRRVPQLRRVLGADGHGVLPQRPAALDAMAGRGLALRDRARAAGRVRRPGHLRRPHRARGRPGPLPAARPLRAIQVREGLGPRPGRRHRARDAVGRPQRRRVRPERRRAGLGHQPELQHQVHREEARGPAAVDVRRGRPELHERRAGGRRHRAAASEPAHPDHRRGAAPASAWWPSST